MSREHEEWVTHNGTPCMFYRVKKKGKKGGYRMKNMMKNLFTSILCWLAFLVAVGFLVALSWEITEQFFKMIG
jgi:hypothetical protein